MVVKMAKAEKAEKDKVLLLPINDQIRELQTIVRDSQTTSDDFVFHADRLIRLVVEEGLNQLPNSSVMVKTPTGCEFEGVSFSKGNCGVSISRSGEAMEKGLRECCRAIRIGKILIDSNMSTGATNVLYSRLWNDIDKRRVMLLYPILKSGNTVLQAIRVLLKEYNVREDKIILLSLFSTQNAINRLSHKYPDVTIVTSEIDPVVPTHFGMKYFGTD